MGVTAISFLSFLGVFVVIGLASMFQSRGTTHDYLLAGHSVPPWLVGLSAVATNNSGYMFTGMIGFTYTTGLSSIWLMVGWLVGDLMGSLAVHRPLRETTEKRNVHSFGGLLAHWHGTDFRVLRALAGFLSLIFLGTYAAAQLNAGSKALHVIFQWDISTGAVIGAAIVLVYCFAGGLRASIWTDAAQSVVMLVAMGVMVAVALQDVGGQALAVERLRGVEEGFMSWLPPAHMGGAFFGPILFIVGWMFAGFGVVGQPHIMVRFMALDDPKNIWRARFWYYGWFFVFYSLTILVGLFSRLLIPISENFDAELALPMLSVDLLPAVFSGLVLAGLFAATMSTADSLILSCSASATRDFLQGGDRERYWLTKGATVLVTVIALVIALNGNQSVFQLVLYSWALLGTAFGPLLVVYALGGRVTEKLAIAMMVGGAGVTFLWNLADLSDLIYEMAPGMVAGWGIYFGGWLFGMVPQRSGSSVAAIPQESVSK